MVHVLRGNRQPMKPALYILAFAMFGCIYFAVEWVIPFLLLTGVILAVEVRESLRYFRAQMNYDKTFWKANDKP